MGIHAQDQRFRNGTRAYIAERSASLQYARAEPACAEVGGQRGTVSCSDLPELSGSILNMALFQPPPPEPGRAPFSASGSPGVYLCLSGLVYHPVQPLAWIPHPVALPLVLSITSGIWVLRPLRHHEALASKVIPKFPSAPRLYLGPLFVLPALIEHRCGRDLS
jgi:hypothetical protein